MSPDRSEPDPSPAPTTTDDGAPPAEAEAAAEQPASERRSLFLEAAADTLRPYAGWLFFGFGVLLVLLGWLGISGESVVAKQLPYLISGGLGGVLLAVLGATFLGMEELHRDSGRLDRMERQIEELHRLLLERPDAPDPSSATDDHTPAPVDDGMVLVVPAGESYHQAGCALVAGKDATEHEPADARAHGLRPCPVCEPAAPADA